MTKSALLRIWINQTSNKAIELSPTDAQVKAEQLLGASSSEDFSAAHASERQGILWLHLNGSDPNLTSDVMAAKLPELETQALLEPDVRPRAKLTDEHLLLTLRGVNLSPQTTPQDMVALRIYIDKSRIITICDTDLKVIDDMAGSLLKGAGPLTAGAFVVDLCRRLTVKKVKQIDALEDKLADLEEMVLTQTSTNARTGLAALRRQAIAIRRYLAPQKEAFLKIVNVPSVMPSEQRAQMHEVFYILLRVIDDLDAVSDRAKVAQEELNSRQSEQLNKRLYFLSLITSIFLPLSFLTGLFGVNLAGMPGLHLPSAFGVFSLSLCFLLLVQIWLFYKFRWFKRN